MAGPVGPFLDLDGRTLGAGSVQIIGQNALIRLADSQAEGVLSMAQFEAFCSRLIVADLRDAAAHSAGGKPGALDQNILCT
jgi:hypothetical protein